MKILHIARLPRSPRGLSLRVCQEPLWVSIDAPCKLLQGCRRALSRPSHVLFTNAVSGV